MIRFYIRQIGFRFYLLIAIITGAGFFKWIGIGRILPILQGVDQQNFINTYFKKFFFFLSIDYNLKNLLLGMAIAITLKAFFSICISIYASRLSYFLLTKMREALCIGLYQIEYEKFITKPLGHIANVITKETEKVCAGFKILSVEITNIFFTLLYFSIPLIHSPKLVLLLVLSGIPLLPMIIKLNSKIKDLSILSIGQFSFLQDLNIQVFNNFKYIKGTNSITKIFPYLQKYVHEVSLTTKRQEIVTSISQYLFEPIIAIAMSVVVYYFVIHKQKSTIELLYIIFLLYSALQNAIALQHNARKILRFFGSVKLIEEMLMEVKNGSSAHQENVADQVELGQDVYTRESSVEFKEVSFRFSNGKEVFYKSTFSFPHQKIVALIGKSGSGKTTILNLLTGLLTPTEGTIFYGTQSHHTLNYDDFCKRVSYVAQENVIFHDTVYNNLTFWTQSKSEEEFSLKQILKDVDLYDHINSLPNKMHSLLSQNGENFSGGQIQRLCWARELFKTPSILILDEATNSLDQHTKNLLLDYIIKVKDSMTIIMVTHDIDLLKKCDIIYHVQNGKVSLVKEDSSVIALMYQ
ncbi:MAG: ABC transporter ATP-binding protein [Oligoflexia bacterium]|nr:ABC transporter ATP-binding protein [Oligoflexia bacterium]